MELKEFGPRGGCTSKILLCRSATEFYGRILMFDEDYIYSVSIIPFKKTFCQDYNSKFVTFLACSFPITQLKQS